MKWYKKIWYLITFRKNKINEYKEIEEIQKSKMRMIDNEYQCFRKGVDIWKY